MPLQDEFLFADGAQPELRLPHALDGLFQEIAAAWGLPVGQRVRLRLRDPALPELAGTLDLVRAPDLPLDPREVLRLRISGVTFDSNEIAAWVLLE